MARRRKRKRGGGKSKLKSKVRTRRYKTVSRKHLKKKISKPKGKGGR